MPLPYDIFRLFTSPQGYLVEIEHPGRLAAPAQAAREWLWVTDCSVTSLRALHQEGSTPQMRNFREAQLQLEGIHAQLSWPNGDHYVLMACSMPALPAAQHQLIHNHLS
ncbi:MAG: hypothetical protein KUL87_09875 [Pseudomonas sp.]|nr:hypothetical protein [Pseudomonas sp.]